MRSVIIYLILIATFGVMCFGQDPVKAASRSYKLQFENDIVKVLRVHYPAREKVPVHDHTRSPAAYIYLNDSGPITFRHTGWDHPVLRRPPVKAGSFRLSPTRFDNETHEAENPNDMPSDFLRIEFKLLPVAKTSVLGRFPRESFPVGRAIRKQHFDNENIRVTRHILPPGEGVKITAGPSEPALLAIVFADGGRGGFEAGRTIWLEAGKERTVENRGTSALEFLRFDIKHVTK